MEHDDGPAALQHVAVLNEAGREAHALRREQPFTIEVRFRVSTVVPGLDLAIQVLDSRGIEVLNEAWSDQAPRRPNGPGEYLARLEIPPLLNVGDYVVGVWIGTRLHTLFHELAARRFRLEGDVKGRPRRSVVVDAPWQVRRVESGDQTVPAPAPEGTPQ